MATFGNDQTVIILRCTLSQIGGALQIDVADGYNRTGEALNQFRQFERGANARTALEMCKEWNYTIASCNTIDSYIIYTLERDP